MGRASLLKVHLKKWKLNFEDLSIYRRQHHQKIQRTVRMPLHKGWGWWSRLDLQMWAQEHVQTSPSVSTVHRETHKSNLKLHHVQNRPYVSTIQSTTIFSTPKLIENDLRKHGKLWTSSTMQHHPLNLLNPDNNMTTENIKPQSEDVFMLWGLICHDGGAWDLQNMEWHHHGSRRRAFPWRPTTCWSHHRQTKPRQFSSRRMEYMRVIFITESMRGGD